MSPHENHPVSHRPDADDMTRCVQELRRALAAHGIILPSLRVDLPSFASRYPSPSGLVALGNCNTDTALRLAEALRVAKAKADFMEGAQLVLEEYGDLIDEVSGEGSA
jgi:hypothetical protein